MPFVYDDSLATAGNLTTNGTANTETEAFFLKPGTTRTIGLKSIRAGGKGAAVTQLSAIVLRCLKWGTASTAGTSLASIAKDASSPATTITSGSRPTSGTTRTNAGPIITFGATSPNSWIAEDIDSLVTLAASNAGSISVMDAASSASMPYETSATHVEF